MMVSPETVRYLLCDEFRPERVDMAWCQLWCQPIAAHVNTEGVETLVESLMVDGGWRLHDAKRIAARIRKEIA